MKLEPWFGVPKDSPPRGTTTFVEGGRTTVDQGLKVSVFHFLPFFDRILTVGNVSSLFITSDLLERWSSTLILFHGVENRRDWSNLMGFVSILWKTLATAIVCGVFGLTVAFLG